MSLLFITLKNLPDSTTKKARNFFPLLIEEYLIASKSFAFKPLPNGRLWSKNLSISSEFSSSLPLKSIIKVSLLLLE